MICPNCQMQQPQNNLAYCVRCNYPLQAKPQGFFSKSNQTGFSRADAYSAARRGQPAPPTQVPYPAVAHNQTPAPQNAGVQVMLDGNGRQIYVQVMRDANGNQIYAQVVYDPAGKPVYVQVMPQVIGRDAVGNPVYGMVPVSQQMQSQQMQSQQMQSRQVQQPQPAPPRQTPPPQKQVETSGNVFVPRNAAAPPPVPVMPRPGEQPEQPLSSIPDRPAIRASTLASAMYAQQSQQTASVPGTGSFFARMQQQKQQIYSGGDALLNAEDLIREEAKTAFTQPSASEPVDENAVLKKIFESKSQEYQMNTGYGNSTFAVDVSPNEVSSVSEKNVYKPAPKASARISRPPEPEEPPKPEPVQETKEEKTDFFKIFGGKKTKEKEKPKHKTIIVDPDEIFGDTKKHKVEMLGITIDGTDSDVDKKMKEMKNGGKKSVRSMIAADVSIESMLDDPLVGDAARKVLTDEAVQQAYDSVESAEIAKALEQLNQGIFPKKF